MAQLRRGAVVKTGTRSLPSGPSNASRNEPNKLSTEELFLQSYTNSNTFALAYP